MCGDFIRKCQANPHFLMWIFTDDELSVFLYIPITKHHSMDWRTESSPKSKTFLFRKSSLKMKCITRNGVWSTKNLWLNEKRRWVNSTYKLEELLKLISRVNPQFLEKGSWFLRAQQCLCCFFYDSKGLPAESWRGGDQPATLFTWPRTSRLFIFPKVKVALKRIRRFQETEEIRKKVIAQLIARSLYTLWWLFCAT